MSKLVMLILAGFLFVSNPESPEFEYYVKKTVASKMDNTTEGDAFINAFTGGLVTGMAVQNTLRKNYYFFSVYTVDMSSIKLFNNNIPSEVKVLGIASQFIPLSGLEK